MISTLVITRDVVDFLRFRLNLRLSSFELRKFAEIESEFLLSIKAYLPHDVRLKIINASKLRVAIGKFLKNKIVVSLDPIYANSPHRLDIRGRQSRYGPVFVCRPGSVSIRGQVGI